MLGGALRASGVVGTLGRVEQSLGRATGGEPVRILVTGGAGYIGSVTAESLQAAGHGVWILDNLSRGHRSAVPRGAPLIHGDVRDRESVGALLRRERIDCVMHFCAASLVGESMEDPGAYFDNNVVGMIHLLRAMVDAGTHGIIFSSSQTREAWGVMPQLVGQVESSSTIEKPNPRTWASKAMRMAFLARRIFLGSCSDLRTTKLAPSRVASSSAARMG